MIREDNDNLEKDTIKDKYSDYGFSNLELDILSFISQGYKPKEIASVRKIEARSVYNAIARIKKKIKTKSA